jgi:hypothetical protein
MSDVHYYAPQTETNNSLSGSLSTPDGVLEKRMKVLRAYQQVGDDKSVRKQKAQEKVKKDNRIRPIDRFKYHKEGKFQHPQTALMNGVGKQPQVDHSNWWKKEATKAGEAANNAQLRCSKVANFTGSVKHNHKWYRTMAIMRGEKVIEDDNDYEADDIHGFGDRTFKFMNKSNVDKAAAHTAVMRQGDFLAEATFRSTLREF